MQTYDILMIVVLLGTTVFGFVKGMAWQIASLASLVVSYYAALRFSSDLAPYFGHQEPLNRFIAMLVIYIATSFVIWMIFRLVSRIIDRVKLEGFDRQLGAILGFAKGVLLCVAITFFAVTLLPPAQGEKIVASRSGRYIVVLLNEAHDVVPPEVHDVIHPYLHKIEERLSSHSQPEGEDLQDIWPQDESQTPAATDWPDQPATEWNNQPAWPAPTDSTPPPWPTTDAATPATPSSSPFGGPTAASPTSGPYPPPREPNPFPGSTSPPPTIVEDH